MIIREDYNNNDHQALFMAMADNDQVAFAQFFDQYKEQVFHMIYRMTGSVPAAQDLSQDFFIRFWQKRTLLNKVRNPAGYMRTVAKRLVYNYGSSYEKSESVGVKHEKKAATNETQETVDMRQLHALIEKALEYLPSAKRSVFTLRTYSGMNYRMISQELNITQQTAKKYYYEATLFLRNYLKHYFIGGVCAASLLQSMVDVHS